VNKNKIIVNSLKIQILYVIYKYSVRTSQRTEFASIGKTSQGILHREVIDVYCENHAAYINALWKQCRGIPLDQAAHEPATEVYRVKFRSKYSIWSVQSF
jgi:hypothetical protein